jgi:hypothetical protein
MCDSSNRVTRSGILGYSPPFAIVAHFNIDDRPASIAKAISNLFGLVSCHGACFPTDGFLQDFWKEATLRPVDQSSSIGSSVQ